MSAEGFRARARPEPPLAQILVVVANTLERSWRTDAEKGFLSTAVAQVLVDPKPRAKALQRGPHDERSSPSAAAKSAPRREGPKTGHEAVGGSPDRPFHGPRSSPRPFCAGRPGDLPGTVLCQTRRRNSEPERPFHPVRGGRSRSGRAARAFLRKRPRARFSRGGVGRSGPGPRWAWEPRESVGIR